MERKMIEYLPYVVREYAEFIGITSAQQDEFERAWDAADDVLNNQFISTAGTLGLSRWEKILKITPKASDTIESRRLSILSKVNAILPFTISVLRSELQKISEGLDFSIQVPTGTYLLEVVTYWDKNGQISSLKNILDYMVPCNLVIQSTNIIISAPPVTNQYVASGITVCDKINLSDATVIKAALTGNQRLLGIIEQCQMVQLSDAINAKNIITGENILASGVTYTENISISD